MNTKGKATLEKFENILRVKNYSERTINNYASYINLYLNFNNKETYKLNEKDLTEYISGYKYSSISQQNQIISSLKLFYRYILNKKISI